MRYVIVDLEATCWDDNTNRGLNEIIEIGAVLLASAQGPVQSEFARFVKPIATQTLSAFCTELTSITQEQVDTAGPYWDVFPAWMEWIGDEPFILCSWGAYDLNQLRKDCDRHKIPFPPALETHINLKKEFSRLKEMKLMGMRGALDVLGIPLEGTHHRGIDDARNIAKIAQVILPQLEAEQSPSR